MHHRSALSSIRRARTSHSYWHRAELGAASAEYAAVTACGVGLGGVLLKLLTSDWGQSMLKTIFDFFLQMLGIG